MKLLKAKGINAPTGTCYNASDCAQGYACIDGECQRAPNQTGSKQCPVEDLNDSCSGCNDPGCKNGIVVTNAEGQKICASKSCSNTKPCPSGYSCKKGTCVKSNCSGNKPCAEGYFCVDGLCSENPPTDTCEGNDDCGYGQGCIGGVCEDIDVEEPPFPIDGQGCTDFCNNFFAENGVASDDCQGKTCGECQRCWNGTCEPDNRTCECREKSGDLPECTTCENGVPVQDCSCDNCSTVFGDVDCGCGLALTGPIQKCVGACANGPNSSTVLNQYIGEQCQQACNNSEEAADLCEGKCTTVTTTDTNFDCPTGFNCKLVGTISAGGQTEYIYRNCDTRNVPDYCEGYRQGLLSFSVIDEDDGYNAEQKDSDWQRFRSIHPDQPFVVLVPNTGNGTVSSPAGYDGGRKSISLDGDWAAAMSGQLAVVASAYAFIDDSGSMTVDDVRQSLNNFIAYCRENGIEFGWTTNTTENWIAPHI